MQNPTRYYILNDDDQPVVRSVPVAVRPAAERPAEGERRAASAPVDGALATAIVPAVAPASARARRRPVRVARLVRAAIGRRGRVR